MSMYSCKENDQRPSHAQFWLRPEPIKLPRIEIIVADKEPHWKSKTTVLLGGDLPQRDWQLVPFSLRKLCAQIPDLSDRTVVILRRRDDYGNPKALPELAVYGPDTHELAFNGGDYSWPVKIYLGRDWCNKQ